ncbi:helix-turn-helix domain-containing protein [uncultured Gilliamella sp.]|uniref:helix-turn-helix domain-containing protein n=1 Tax=uncultured Gilliamella sp. TaxID=1193505 RepID=UPI0025E36A9C|nr:helix-turn-helix domain-containing protein [uncultured Gilliamella sp.]
MEDNISLGKILSNSRDNLGLTQEDIANKLHVRKAVVSEIENDQLVHAPFVFVKGYIRAYAEIVGLPNEEYQPYLEDLKKQYSSQKITELVPKDKKTKGSSKVLFAFLFIFLCALGATLYFVTKQDKSNLVEVSHYISPPTSDRVNS